MNFQFCLRLLGLWIRQSPKKKECLTHGICSVLNASSSYGHMIDNVVLIVTGTLHERDVHELLEKCHPLGMFDRYYRAIFLLSRYLPAKVFFCIYGYDKILSQITFFFPFSIATLAVAQNMRELYRLVLVDTPLAPYFSECITSEVRSSDALMLDFLLSFVFSNSFIHSIMGLCNTFWPI